jgi:hypothetical protein
MARTVSVGFVIAGVGTPRTRAADVESYAAAWPWYLLCGLGYGVLVPGVVGGDPRSPPITRAPAPASQFLAPGRRGGGLAVLGSLSVAAASRAWRGEPRRPP